MEKQIEIIAETDSFLLVYKPAGLPVETRSVLQRSLLQALKTGQGYAGADGTRRRNDLSVINRLDQVVEGLVLLAKTKKAAAILSKQMQAHQMEKEYLAVVDGTPASDSMELCDHLLRDGRTNMSRVVPSGTKGAKAARLQLTCLEKRGEKSLLRIRLDTGRHHQIRVQLAHVGLPVCGDRKYHPSFGVPAAGSRTDEMQPVSFPALCACALAFSDPETGERLRFEIEPKGALFA